MKQFKFTTDEPLDVPSATLSTSRWMKRRAYPIQLVSVTPYEVIVELDAPDNAHHNRAVNALGKILSRQLDRRHFVQSHHDSDNCLFEFHRIDFARLLQLLKK